MKFSLGQIDHLAKLCRLKLSQKEKEEFQKELSSILNWVNQLAEVDTSKIEPISQITNLKNVMREDVVDLKTREEKLKKRDELLKNAIETKDGFVKIKAVLN